MESQINNISTQAKLSAIAGIMFFAPLINNSIKSKNLLSDTEKEFVSWYVKVWYFNLVLLAIIVIAIIINLTLISQIALRIANIGCLVVYVVLFFSIFACINNLIIRWNGDSIKQNIQYKDQIIKVLLPIRNFNIRYKQENYNSSYRWLKESVLRWIIFIFWTLIFGNIVWIWIIVTILTRFILLLLNIDIIPLSIKKAINWMFLCNPWEITAYITAPIIAKLKRYDYQTVLNAEKFKYEKWQIGGVGTIVQYVLFLIILFLFYRWIEISPYYIVSIFAIIMWFARIIIFYKYKKSFPKIPILSEFIWLFIK